MSKNENVTQVSISYKLPRLYKLSLLERLYVKWGFKTVIDIDEDTRKVTSVRVTQPGFDDVHGCGKTVETISNLLTTILGRQIDDPHLDNTIRAAYMIAESSLIHRIPVEKIPALPKTGRPVIDERGA